MNHMRNCYYLDSSVLLEEDFYQIIEKLWTNVPGVSFLLDAGIGREIESYHSLGRTEEALTLANLVNLLSSLEGTVSVDTATLKPNYRNELFGGVTSLSQVCRMSSYAYLLDASIPPKSNDDLSFLR